jgi:hypothetical protein
MRDLDENIDDHHVTPPPGGEGPLFLGLRTPFAVQPGENQQDFDDLCGGLLDTWRPANRAEQNLVEKMAINEWQLVRLQRSQFLILQAHGNIIDAQNLLMFDRLSQYQARLERFSLSLHKELQKIVKARKSQDSSEDGDPDDNDDDQPTEYDMHWVDENGNDTIKPIHVVLPPKRHKTGRGRFFRSAAPLPASAEIPADPQPSPNFTCRPRAIAPIQSKAPTCQAAAVPLPDAAELSPRRIFRRRARLSRSQRRRATARQPSLRQGASIAMPRASRLNLSTDADPQAARRSHRW